MRASRSPNTFAISILRIAVGFLFATFGEYKVFGRAFTLDGGFQTAIKGFLNGGAYPFMVPVLRGILAHFATPMSFAAAYGEFLIGVSLLIGLWSRIASVFGFALMMAMWFSGGYPGPHAAFWMYWGASLNWSVFALCFVVLALGRPDEIWALRSYSSRS